MKSLQDPVGCLKGVGPKTVEALATLDIKTVEDLLTYFPSRYDDFAPTDLSTAKSKSNGAWYGELGAGFDAVRLSTQSFEFSAVG